jgi:hypothetical protein
MRRAQIGQPKRVNAGVPRRKDGRDNARLVHSRGERRHRHGRTENPTIEPDPDEAAKDDGSKEDQAMTERLRAFAAPVEG